MNSIVLVLLFSFVAPLPLLVIERFLPYPFFVEELVKLICVIVLIQAAKKAKKNLLPVVIASGLLFTVSESMFYLLNIFATNTFAVFFQRLVFTGILHVTTLVIMFTLGKKGTWWLLIGFLLAVVIHFSYNYVILHGV